MRHQALHNRNAVNVSIPIGAWVYCKNRAVRGQNKIQDAWDTTPYQVVERPNPEGNVYMIKPLIGEGPITKVNQKEL